MDFVVLGCADFETAGVLAADRPGSGVIDGDLGFTVQGEGLYSGVVIVICWVINRFAGAHHGYNHGRSLHVNTAAIPNHLFRFP
jgi:hypothetical protein